MTLAYNMYRAAEAAAAKAAAEAVAKAVAEAREEALKEGHITQEQMQEALDTVSDLESNYHRLVYIMYLLAMPNRKEKKSSYVKQHKIILEELKRLGADIDSIKEENSDALIHFKAALEALKSE